MRMHSNDMEDIQDASAGDIVAVFGLDCHSGDTFTDGNINVSMTSMFVPSPVISLSIKPKDSKARKPSEPKKESKDEPKAEAKKTEAVKAAPEKKEAKKAASEKESTKKTVKKKTAAKKENKE